MNTYSTLLTDKQLSDWAVAIARKIDDIYSERDTTFTHDFGGFECEIHRTADIRTEYSDICGPSWWCEDERVEVVGVWGIMADHPEDELSKIAQRLEAQLN